MIKTSAKFSLFNRNARFLNSLTNQSVSVYRIISNMIVMDIIKILKAEKMMKSDGDWTSDVPKVRLNIKEITDNVISKHLSALKYILLGDYAGKEAKKSAKNLNILDKVVPGVIQSSYFGTIDVQREYYTKLFGVEPPAMSQDIIQVSLEEIRDRINRLVDQLNVQIENSILNAIERVSKDLNGQLLEQGKKMVTAGEKPVYTGTKADIEDVVLKGRNQALWARELKESLKVMETSVKRTIKTEVALSSSVANHQVMYELFDGDDNMYVAVITTELENVCSFCSHASKHPNGEYKLYEISEIKPSGYNIGKKRANWKVSVPPQHPSCYCSLAYIPNGFYIDHNGEVKPFDRDK